MEITTFLLQNIIQWLSTSIEFNDLIRLVVDDGATTIETRYNSNDTFAKHVEDDTLIQPTTPGLLYPYIGIDFGEYTSPIFDCGILINITFTMLLKTCTPEDGTVHDIGEGSFDTGECSIQIVDARQHFELLVDFLINMFHLTIVDDTTGEVRKSNLFYELACTEQEIWNCDTEQFDLVNWEYNVWAQLSGNPIISPIRRREDGVLERNLIVPVLVDRMLTTCDCV